MAETREERITRLAVTYSALCAMGRDSGLLGMQPYVDHHRGRTRGMLLNALDALQQEEEAPPTPAEEPWRKWRGGVKTQPPVEAKGLKVDVVFYGDPVVYQALKADVMDWSCQGRLENGDIIAWRPVATGPAVKAKTE